MHAQIRITMDTAAFEDNDGRTELAAILHSAAERISESDDKEFQLGDCNGNTVGHFKIIGQPRRFARE